VDALYQSADTPTFSSVPQKGPLSESAWALIRLIAQQLKCAASQTDHADQITLLLSKCFDLLRSELQFYYKELLTPLTAKEKSDYDMAISAKILSDTETLKGKDAALQAEVIESLNSISYAKGGTQDALKFVSSEKPKEEKPSASPTRSSGSSSVTVVSVDSALRLPRARADCYLKCAGVVLSFTYDLVQG